MKMADKPMSKAATASSAFGLELPTLLSPCTAAPGNMTAAWPKYTEDGLGGLDVSDFTADIGKNSSPGAALCGKLAWLGVKLDEQANDFNGPRISTSDSSISVWVIPTDEELMIAQYTMALVKDVV